MAADEKALKPVKTKLEREQKRLGAELKKLKQYHDYGQSEDANAQEMEEFEEQLALGKNLQRVFDETKAALQRIGDGSYGKCQACGQPIEPARLKAYPATAYCLKDEAKRDRRWWQVWRR